MGCRSKSSLTRFNQNINVHLRPKRKYERFVLQLGTNFQVAKVVPVHKNEDELAALLKRGSRVKGKSRGSRVRERVAGRGSRVRVRVEGK